MQLPQALGFHPKVVPRVQQLTSRFLVFSLGLAFFLPGVWGGGRVLAWCQYAGRCRDCVLTAEAAALSACHAVPSVHWMYL